ncbi:MULTISPECIES: hypothetical protein [unclassified Adlercreutzia]|uniref:hypothetical protein n=1 Tax=unclassified Adlercreutzia TaxID=2636013 RepID=UPI0013EC6691|nr:MULTISPECIES: hypothetical protein [unclassified Adlercreutzia]
MTIFDKRDIVAGAQLACKKCGEDLNQDVRPSVVRCGFSGLMCAYPCGKSASHNLGEGAYRVCEKNTPPRETPS